MKGIARISMVALLAMGFLFSCTNGSGKLSGVWTSEDNPLYPTLEFKGKSTVVIGTIMGPFATSYERDGEYIRVRTDQSDLLFKFEGKGRLVGSGFADGVWIKDK